MSGIFDQIINYSPPLIVSGTVNYKGTWDASTNNPPLSNPPVASTKGDYYVVSTAGTQFSISFAVGDWIISSGTAWEKVDLTDAVSSVFGRTGAVVGVSTDYSAVGLTNTAIGASSPSTGAFTTVTASSTIAATGAVTGSNLSGTNTGDQTTITGNAGSATILQTARNINGVSFNGSADITVAAAAGTLTGSTLASGVTASLLTSLGTIASLVATTADINGGTIDGTTVGATTPSTVAATTISATGSITTSGGTLETNRTGAVDAFVRISADAGRSKNLSLNTSGARRWTVSSNSTAESGSNAGSDFVLTAYSDADASLGSALTITRANRSAVFAGGINSTAIGATTPSTGRFTTVRLDNTDVLTWGGAYGAGIPSILGSTGAGELQFRPTGSTNGTVATLSSTGLAVTGALTASGAINSTQDSYNTFGSAAGQGLIRIGSASPSGDNVGWLVFNTSNSQYNWRIAANTITSGALDISASTVAGGSTFTTSIAKFSSTGLAVTGALSATGNVGVAGVAVPTGYNLATNTSGANTGGKIGTTSIVTSTSDYPYVGYNLRATNSSNSYNYDVTDTASALNFYNGGFRFFTAPSGTAGNPITFTERMNLTTTGLAVTAQGTPTGAYTGATLIANNSNSTSWPFATSGYDRGYLCRISQTSGLAVYFETSSATTLVNAGSISVSGTGTTYSTSSDYRRKSNLQDLTGSGTFIDSLKPRTFDWDTGDKGVGFIAHEFAEVSPSSVVGEKDAVDADGKPVYQAMQASSAEVIANLVAELQSLRQRVAALESN